MSFGLIPLVVGVGGKLSRAVYLTPTRVLKVRFFYGHSSCFKIYEYEIVSFIIII